MAHKDNGSESQHLMESDKEKMKSSWSGPRTVTVHRAGGGFGFTLRHFIVYPPESVVQQLQEEEQRCEPQDGSRRKRSKLSALDPMDTIFVKQVKESGPAQQAGLQKGDRIISVNGESVTGKSYSQVIALIQSSDSTLKLLVVPKDEDILQMAYESSAYNQGKEPYKGSATEIPHPPQIYQQGSDAQQAAQPNFTQPARFKSEIRMVPEDAAYGAAQKSQFFDPRIPRQRLSTSSMGSMSSGSSYSTSKDVGLSYPQQMDVGLETGDAEDVVMAPCGGMSSGEAASGRLVNDSAHNQSSAHKSYSSADTRGPSAGASFTPDLSPAAAAAATNPSLTTSSLGFGSHLPPAAPSRSSSKNMNLHHPSPSRDSRIHDRPYNVCSNPQLAGQSYTSQRRGSNRDRFEDTDKPGSRTGNPPKSPHLGGRQSQGFSLQGIPAVEKLLMTSHETRPRRSSRDALRHSSDNINTTSSNGTLERQAPKGDRLVSTTYLPPGASTTITLTPNSRSNTTSSWLSDSPNQSQSSSQSTVSPHHQWPSDSHVYKMDTTQSPDTGIKHPGVTSHSAKDMSHYSEMSASDQNLSSLGSTSHMSGDGHNSYGLTVSLHMEPGKGPLYTDQDPNVPNNSSRNSVPERSMINMVTERLRKFESAESVDNAACWRQRKPRRVGYDSVLSRAAEFEHRYGDEGRSDDDQQQSNRWKRSSRTSPYSTPSGSTSSLPQAVPPLEMHKVPQTPPATINFYFRDGKSPGPAHSSLANLEPSPEMLLGDAEGFRVRVSSEPPEISRSGIGRERSPLTNISISYGEDSLLEDGRRNKPATRQPSYLAAVSKHQDQSMPPNSSNITTGTTTSTMTTSVTLRERSRSAEDREARLVRRTSYLMATGRQNNAGSGGGAGGVGAGTVDVSQLQVPPPAVMPSTLGDLSAKSQRARLDLPLQQLEVMPELCESPGTAVTPDNRSPVTPLTPTSPRLPLGLDIVTTPTKTSNIKKLKSLFGERTPRILEAITDKKNLFDMPSPVGGLTLEGTLICKVAVADGKRASDRSWKPAYAQLRGHALYLFRDKNNVSPSPFEDQPISVKSSIVDIAYDYTKKKNVFRLTTYNGSEYLFQAEDHDTMLQWIRMIQANNNPDEDKESVGNTDLIVRKTAQQQESIVFNKYSPQVIQKAKKTSTRSLRSKSPSSHSPGSKPKKQLSEKEHMDQSGPKSKDARTWKDRMAIKFKRYGSSSSASADIPEVSESSEITGTFCVPLESCPCSTTNEYVPLVVEICTKIVEERGLENQGIYRVPGNTGAVNSLQEEFNKASDIESLDMDNEKWMDVNVVSSLLKSFFRKLPDPLITEELYQTVILANRTANQEKRMLKIKKLLHELPDHNFETFHYIAEHLRRVADKGDLNKMDGRNLAIVFGPTLIRTSDDNMITMVTDMSDQCRIVESIISNCKWFFSSWSEDVNVPVELQTDTVPVSGMNQELLVKAENLELGERGRDVSVKDLMSSVIHAANRKIRRRDKPKGSESVDIDIESEPSSYNERNIDREIELRKGRDVSNHSVAKDSSSLSLEQASSISTALSCSISVQESKSSVSLDQGRGKDLMSSSVNQKMSSSSLAVLSPVKPGPVSPGTGQGPPSQAADRKPDPADNTPIKRYPAYPKVDISLPQVDNYKPMLFKKYSSEELTRPDWRRDNDEVKKTYGLTPQTRQHLKRIEQETQVLRQREAEKRRDQEKHALAKRRIEQELQKTRRELEEDHSLDDLLSHGGGSGYITSKITDSKQKYSDFINSSMDNRSITSDYSTMSSTNIPSYGHGSSDKPGSVDYSHVRYSASVPRELCYGSAKNQDNTKVLSKRRDSANSAPCPHKDPSVRHELSTRNKIKSSASSLSSHPRGAPCDDMELSRSRGPRRGKTFDVAKSVHDTEKLSGSEEKGQQPRKGSLDSLLDIYDHDLSHIDSEEEDAGHKTEEGLLESIASAGPQFKLIPSGSAPKHTKTNLKLQSSNTKSADKSRSKPENLPVPRHKSESVLLDRPFRDPTLHKTAVQRDSKIVGIGAKDHNVKSLSCYNSDSRLSGGSSSGSGSRPSGVYSRQSKENKAPLGGKGFSTGSVSTHKGSSTEPRQVPSQKPAGSSNHGNHPSDADKLLSQHSSGPQGSSSSRQEHYPSALRKSTEKLLGSCENLIDLRSPDTEPPPFNVDVTAVKLRTSSEQKSAKDRKSKRRRYTVGGPGDLEHYQALLLATQQNGERAEEEEGEAEQRSAWDRLQPRSPERQQVHDVQSWCLQQRLRHVGSSPALFDPSLVASEEPPLKRKGSVKTGEEKPHRAPSRSGSSRSQSTKSSCHSSSPSPSSPGPGTNKGGPAGFGFVSSV